MLARYHTRRNEDFLKYRQVFLGHIVGDQVFSHEVFGSDEGPGSESVIGPHDNHDFIFENWFIDQPSISNSRGGYRQIQLVFQKSLEWPPGRLQDKTHFNR